MGYKCLLPSMAEYAQKFKQLGSLDFKIIKAICKYGGSNLSRVAEAVGVPQQTVSYHVRKFDRQNLVRFRALISEAKLGLRSYSVLAGTPSSKEKIASRAMTCFPLWRYLAIVDGWKRGNYVRYAVPPDKERDLGAFLKELENKELVSDFEVIPTASPSYPLIDVDFYIRNKRNTIFNWKNWVKNYDSFPETESDELNIYKKAEFDLYDLIILRCLEINAQTTQRKIVKEIAKIIGEKEYNKFIPMVSRRIRDRINHQGLISSYRAYLFPSPGPLLLFMFYLVFSNSSSLRRFIAGLSHLPYNTAYEKALERDVLLVRFVIPAYEFSDMRTSLADLAQNGCIKDSHLFLGDLTEATWDNVEIYQMFKDGAWSFSYGASMEMLENALFNK